MYGNMFGKCGFSTFAGFWAENNTLIKNYIKKRTLNKKPKIAEEADILWHSLCHLIHSLNVVYVDSRMFSFLSYINTMNKNQTEPKKKL